MRSINSRRSVSRVAVPILVFTLFVGAQPPSDRAVEDRPGFFRSAIQWLVTSFGGTMSVPGG